MVIAANTTEGHVLAPLFGPDLFVRDGKSSLIIRFGRSAELGYRTGFKFLIFQV